MYILFFVPLMIVFIQKLKSIRMAVGMCIIAVLYQVILKKMDIVYIYSFPLSRIVDVFVACNLGCLFCSFGGAISGGESMLV